MSSFIIVCNQLLHSFNRANLHSVQFGFIVYLMDPTGFAIGVISLAALFDNAVNCFEYIQLGRAFGKNYQVSLLKLDNARLRLSRWGKAVGLGCDVENTRSLQSRIAAPSPEVKQAEAILGQIVDLFLVAEGVSNKFKTRVSSNDTKLVLYDEKKDMEPVPRLLHEQMRELSISRQKGTSFLKKAKWALYEEKQFKRLIEDITELVNALVELFPAAQATQKQLCEIEVQTIGTAQSLPVLKEVVAGGQDKFLEAAVEKAILNNYTYTHTISFTGNNNSGFQVGHNAGTISNHVQIIQSSDSTTSRYYRGDTVSNQQFGSFNIVEAGSDPVNHVVKDQAAGQINWRGF